MLVHADIKPLQNDQFEYHTSTEVPNILKTRLVHTTDINRLFVLIQFSFVVHFVRRQTIGITVGGITSRSPLLWGG